MQKSLRLTDISKSFPGVQALQEVGVEFLAGEVHALLGENGAGKSTLIKIVSGAYTQYEGSVEIDGRKVSFRTPKEAIEAGISVIYQELNLCGNISIAENIFLGELPKRASGAVDRVKLISDARRLLSMVNLGISPDTKVGRLSTAQQQLVEIAKALSHRSSVLVMDEPTSALSPRETENLFGIIRSLKARGTAIVFVSHKLDEVFQISDRVTVLRDGKLAGTFPIDRVDHDFLVSRMVGRSVGVQYPKTPADPGDVVLEVSDLGNDFLSGISFHVRAGEIVGFAGLMGSGRTELAKAVFGFDGIRTGRIELGGKKLPSGRTAAARRMGIGFVPEDRKREGLFHYLSVMKNSSIASLPAFSTWIHIRSRLERKRVQDIVSSLRIKTPSLEQLVEKLSGGNQQKVILSRWLVKDNLRLLIVDEPTRGIDIGAKAEIYGIIDDLASRGLAVMIMSSEMPELLNMSDRIYVLHQGRIAGELTAAEATGEKVLKLAIGEKA